MFGPPKVIECSDDERDELLGYLQWQREQVVATADGLDADQLRWTPDGKLLPIIGIVNHLACVERRWIVGRYLGETLPPRSDDEFKVPLDVPATAVIDAYWRQGRRTDEVARAAPSLEVACTGGGADGKRPIHELLGLQRPVNLRWVLLHLIEETAHHAGHADSTRELLDGTKQDW